ncbi:MAG: hypothetical protein V4616_08230 [Bacteroidota bacterium]
MKTYITLVAAVLMLASCDKDYRYSDNNSKDQAASAEVLRGTVWESDKETERSFINNIMLNEKIFNFSGDDEGQNNSNNAFDLVFNNNYVYKVMKNSGDTTETNRYKFDGNTLFLFNSNSATSDTQDDESFMGSRVITIQGNIMTSIDLGMDRSGSDNGNRTERITILRRLR